ncbi:MAG: HAD family phosphatase [Yoonia sp.]|nr:HAD family phosphatase [Yoonia sp.]
MTKLVIFDCDGVLIDSEPPTLRVIADSLTRYGLAMQPEDVAAQFTGGALMDLGIAATALGATLPDDWLTQTYDEMFMALREGVALIDGILPLLDKLDTAGIAKAIASNGPMEKMGPIYLTSQN